MAATVGVSALTQIKQLQSPVDWESSSQAA